MKRFAWISALLLMAGPALADAPAAIPADAGRMRAETSFAQFAADWMAKVRALEQRHRNNPTVEQGGDEPRISFRGYGDDYTIELRPTGNVRAPYVGLLRYTEHVYNCPDKEVERCKVASSVPVTEIFRFQNGRWNY